ncbi:hypothetical protein HanXRQr2_Chr12g0536711 [Helianthus annuus]|uniref:Uncharacterized protein n=1 Tax=Helianthus annuus TaxID=4232 RepID=A0A9K3HFT4_HELAN|nr:hypothetical protein HanXRQr2_Chr12g0536711 [Helianthus annuus]
MEHLLSGPTILWSSKFHNRYDAVQSSKNTKNPILRNCRIINLIPPIIRVLQSIHQHLIVIKID